MRTLLICLLVLAVPAQGWAAATMLFCKHGQHGASAAASASGHGVTPQAAPLATRHAPHHAGLAAPSAHDHGATLASASASASANADDAAATQAAPGDGDAPDGAHKCSACAACCSAGAPPQAMTGMPAPEFMPTVFDTVTPTVQPFTSDGLDRPPRSASA